MPSFWETYPCTRHPVEFRLLENLVRDIRYSLLTYPCLETPRQISLDTEDPDEFKSIPRDFCILTSPGKISWQTKDAQKEPKLEIFHSDIVKIPVADLKAKFQILDPNRNDTSYLNRYYLDSMTRTNVEKIFKDGFGLSIPLNSETSSSHWIPAVVLYNVEVRENEWENRLAMFFDGNVEISMQSMRHRVKDYGQKLKSKILGRLYLDIWRSKWAKDEDEAIFLTTRNTASVRSAEVNTNPLSEPTILVSSTLKARGRKRRAVLRQLRTSSSLNQPDKPAGVSLVSPELSAVTVPIVRGRLRRRERRRNRRKPWEDRQDIQLNTFQYDHEIPSAQESRTPSSEESQIWRFDNGEIGPEDPNNKFPVILSFKFHESESDPATQVSEGLPESEETIQEVFTPLIDELPILDIKPLDKSQGLVSSKRYRIVSYSNPHPDPLGTPGLPLEPVITSAWGGSDDEDVSGIGHYQIHIADLVDMVGVVDSSNWRASAFFSIIEANPAALRLPGNPLLGTSTKDNYGNYWHRFSALLYGFYQTGEQRELPYSLGYGVDHNNPVLISKDNRWGFLEVDSVSRKSKRPRWRASWRFEMMSANSEKCECSLNNVTHDINTCRSLYKEEAVVGVAPWRSRTMAEEIFSSPLQYAHKPYEYLRDLEKILHEYHPPYVPASDGGDSSGSSSVTAPDNAEESEPHEKSETRYSKQDEDSKHSVSDSSQGNNDPVEIEHKGIIIPPQANATQPVKSLSEAEEIEIKKRQTMDAERSYELGVCSLMALGVPKDIKKGIELIKRSAKLGCFRGKATALSIASAYGIELDVSGETLKNWLCETAFQGSRIALQDLRSQFPGIYRDCMAARRDTFDSLYPKTINYTDDIMPHFDLSNSELLLGQIERFNANNTDQSPEAPNSTISKANLNVVARVTEGNEREPTRFFVFGSLLHMAATFGHLEAASILLDAGFDIEAQNAIPALRTPLLCAMNRGHTDIATLLIKRGASCQPVMMWAHDYMFCSTPTALHYLVNIENDSDMKTIARLLVRSGADVNFKCDVENLRDQTPTEIPVLKGRSITPLRWAVIHQKPQVVKILLNLGAKFAYEEYTRPSLRGKPESSKLQKGCLLLETPCTDLDILEMFFARARVPGLPVEFSQTPLGLLVSEDDGPERRLRPGFRDIESVREALDLLLELQPGCEDVVMWSAVRHDHMDIVKYLLEDLGWNIESQWRGLTNLHTAILYGRTELVRYLLAKGANARAVTKRRQLTCLHLLMLVPRHPQVDQEIFDCISNSRISVDSHENADNLTAFNLAVRNQKLPLIKQLLIMGANPTMPVVDQLSLLSEGKGGYLERTPDRPQLFTKNLTILGEVLIQYIQDNFYPYEYISDLLFLLLDHLPTPLSEADLVVDKGINLSLLHLLAILPPHSDHPHIFRREKNRIRWNEPPPAPLDPLTAPASLLQLVLIRCSPSAINYRDIQGDTPLHYACASHQLHHIRTLLSLGANPTIRNEVGLNAVETMAWSVIFLSGKTLRFHAGRKSWHPDVDFAPRYEGRRYKRGCHPASALSIAFSIFAELGLYINPQLQKFVLGWDYAIERGDDGIHWDGPERNHLEIVPEESARGIVDDREPDSHYKANGKYDTKWDERIKRPYTLGTVKGATKWRTQYGTEGWERQHEVDFEREAL